jgi:hypothetical protein
MSLKVEYDNTGCIQIAQDGAHWWALVKMEINFLDHLNDYELLKGCVPCK